MNLSNLKINKRNKCDSAKLRLFLKLFDDEFYLIQCPLWYILNVILIKRILSKNFLKEISKKIPNNLIIKKGVMQEIMLSKVNSVALRGLAGYLIEVQVDISMGMPCWEIVRPA